MSGGKHIWLRAGLALLLALATRTARADLLDDEDMGKKEPPPSVVPTAPKKEAAPVTKQEAPSPASTIKAPTPHSKDKNSPNTAVIPPKSGATTKGGKKAKAAADELVHFASKGARGLREKGMLELEQEVVITQADMKLESDHAIVYGNEATHEVVKVVAEGNVKINGIDENSGERFRAFGDHATFLNKERTVVLEGNARLWRGSDSVIRSKKITYEMNTGWIRADRVAGELQPNDAGGPTKPIDSPDNKGEAAVDKAADKSVANPVTKPVGKAVEKPAEAAQGKEAKAP